jgi:hypothetical protein
MVFAGFMMSVLSDNVKKLMIRILKSHFPQTDLLNLSFLQKEFEKLDKIVN